MIRIKLKPTDMTTTLQPLSQSHRDQNLDILRGFALAGVLFVFCTGDMDVSESYVNSVLDETVKWFKWVMIEERMYSMLILVFGMGFSVQVRKSIQKNESLVPVFLRRLIGLLLIGSIHAIFISSRDILIFYGLAGLALLPVRNLSKRQILVYLVIVLLMWLNLYLILKAIGIKPVLPTSWVSPNDLSSYWKFNWQFFKEYHQMYTIYFDMLFYFLLGFYIQKFGLLKKIEENRMFRKKLLIWSLILASLLGVSMYGWYLNGGGWKIVKSVTIPWQKTIIGYLISLLTQLERLSFVTLYALTLISINSSVRGKKFLQPLARFGQMALSNYLIQSLLLVPYALWFNKFGNMPPFTGFIVFLVVLTLQLIFSTAWLKHFLFGPFEWWLRSFTYWKWQPWKRKNETNLKIDNQLQPVTETGIDPG